jgi:helicase required for RNAi-mediated heterochromatin assembly 1
LTLSRVGVGFRVAFSTDRCHKQIRWEQSDRLKQGTIVALTTHRDLFNTICKVAVVAARPLDGLKKDPPEVDIFWGDPNDAEFDPAESKSSNHPKATLADNIQSISWLKRLPATLKHIVTS